MGKRTSNPQTGILGSYGDLRHYLLGWYDKVHGHRQMPWRLTKDPYAIWLSETMLQQTQVETVKPYFRKFLEHFPTIEALAAAELDTVLALWAGLGYYRRAKHLHAAAKQMVALHGGRMPEDLAGLLALPGVGRYTAGAVGSIAFGLPLPVVDGNVKRVVARLTGFDGDIGEVKNEGYFWEIAEDILRKRGGEMGNEGDESGKKGGKTGKKGGKNGFLADVGAGLVGETDEKGGRYGDVNQAMMELGATVCVPQKPACLVCPVREFCRAYAEGRQEALPVKGKKGAVPEVRGVAVVVRRSGRESVASGQREEVLMVKRPAGVVWEGMWEFPVIGEWSVASGQKGSGGVGEGLRREIEQMLGVGVGEMEICGEVVHTLTHRRMVYGVVRGVVKNETGGENQRVGVGEGLGGGGGVLPVCREGGRYVEARWVGWPLVKGSGLAWGRVVEKIAACAE